ncbi:MAG TPA: sulfotransferase [Sphingomicrobium sp.]|nr:sulfotransferase [Sphingomicrobium sp.]
MRGIVDEDRDRSMTRKPNLFIVGAPKCGTTAWAQYLSTHPDIFFSPVKEPHYFSPDMPKTGTDNFPTEDKYLALFEHSGNAKILGEGSTRYLRSQEAARNIRQFNPDAKIIIFVRDQPDYLPSLHNHLVWRKDECITDFKTAWNLSGKREQTNIGSYSRGAKFLDYMEAGAFSPQVERYFDQFPEDQIRVFHYQDWTRDPRATYLEILKFLGVADDGRSEFPRVNAARRRRTKFLWRLLKDPPRPARAAVALAKRLTGARTLHLARFLRWADTKKGGQTRADDGVKQEIAAHFEADNAKLEPRIWRPASS